ncbi:hypothetical protein K7R09_24130 [Serratia ureilytica]|uniref:Contractile injection system tube protein N-terminal domain-containing protein n=1 Tax=Serratia ureilytica TaxID=300181 RepID=A0ABU0VR05_9GAMM|nr:hypothetical protein [Serratia ureilytica]MCU7064893.1 hypothetical protein [Serratia ureilytica]MDQ1811323.1 hypothetical protein [Serratia ureilytica]MDQ1840384.1 hypothetical protein [Serratia ureilytica]MDQ1863856.1 hypothetical protein [Serratia ureilytica]
MGLLERGLSKLTLTAYQGDNQQKKLGELKAMYNPASVNLDYAADYHTMGGINQRHDVSRYQHVSPPTLSLELILDARGPAGGRPIDKQLSDLRALCFTVSEKGEAPYLRISWGSMSWHGHGYFAGRLLNLSIAYTLFDRTAVPMRATATLTLRAQTSDEMEKIKALRPLKAQALQVSDKTSLPQLLAQATTAAGCAAYLTTAYANDMDHLSGLSAGQTLFVR